MIFVVSDRTVLVICTSLSSLSLFATVPRAPSQKERNGGFTFSFFSSRFVFDPLQPLAGPESYECDQAGWCPCGLLSFCWSGIRTSGCVLFIQHEPESILEPGAPFASFFAPIRVSNFTSTHKQTSVSDLFWKHSLITF